MSDPDKPDEDPKVVIIPTKPDDDGTVVIPNIIPEDNKNPEVDVSLVTDDGLIGEETETPIKPEKETEPGVPTDEPTATEAPTDVSSPPSEEGTEEPKMTCTEKKEATEGKPGTDIPQCEEDGSYTPKQCSASTGYCWCVDENGVKAPGTEVKPGGGTPHCKGNLFLFLNIRLRVQINGDANS